MACGAPGVTSTLPELAGGGGARVAGDSTVDAAVLSCGFAGDSGTGALLPQPEEKIIRTDSWRHLIMIDDFITIIHNPAPLSCD